MSTKAAGATRRWAVAGVACLVAGAALAWHARETFARFPPGKPSARELPFTQDDHPFHFYYGQLTTDFFARRCAFWGYDPNFMAGYAKTLIFPTSSTLPEVVAIISGWRAAYHYRVFVGATLVATPLLLGCAAARLGRSWLAFALGVCLAVLWVWCGFPAGFPAMYASWGMGPFIVASAASVLSATLLASWLDEASRLSLVGGTLLATFATIAHPSSPVILVLMLLPAYLAKARSLNWRKHLVAWSVPLVVIVAWSPWWLPAVILRETYGTTATGFKNEDIWVRLRELVEMRFPEETALVLAAIPAAVGLWGVGAARLAVTVGGAGGLFATAYLASYFPSLWSVQPDRYTQPLYACLVVLIAAGCARLAGKLMERPRRVWYWLAAVSLLVPIRVAAPKVHHYFSHDWPPFLHAALPPHVFELAQFLRQHADSTGRVLFEDHGRGETPDEFDPFLGTNPSALLPLLAPGQYIGGPYLYVHQKTVFTQFGDGLFCGKSIHQLDRTTFDRYARLYNLRWAVLRSAAMVRLAEANPDLFDRQAQFGPVHVYKLVRAPNWAIAGSARVSARPDRLEVTDASPGEDGVLVLSYHWIRTLRSEVRLRPALQEDDPVAFIAVDNPPREFVIENRLW